ncbi:hypothetical protein V8E36_003602 [Tilletia maclaganii]
MVAVLSLVGELALGSSFVQALPPLERNIAYRSPSLTLHHLRHDRRATPADSLVDSWNGSFGPDGAMAYQGNVTFPYGIASGDPYDDSVILWTHPVPTTENVTQPICLTYQVSTDKAGKNVVTSNYAWTTSDVGYSFKVEATGLKAKTDYYYRFATCANRAVQSPTGHFRILPKPDDYLVTKLSFATFSCSNFPFGFFNAYAAAASKDLDLWLHVGDFIYEYAGNGSPDSYGDGRNISRVPQPDREIVSLEDYRTRYADYKTDSGLQALSAAHKCGHDREADILICASALYRPLPIRQACRLTQFIPLGLRHAPHSSFSMLDTRQYERDITDFYYNTDVIAAMSNDTNRSLMGGKQEQWLYNNLANDQKSGIKWKIVGQQIIAPPADAYNYDAWDGYKANRRRISTRPRTTPPPGAGGSLGGVEFGGNGGVVSSPSSYGRPRTLTPAQYVQPARANVTYGALQPKVVKYASSASRGWNGTAYQL